jgi:hypothetical protein
MLSGHEWMDVDGHYASVHCFALSRLHYLPYIYIIMPHTSLPSAHSKQQSMSIFAMLSDTPGPCSPASDSPPPSLLQCLVATGRSSSSRRHIASQAISASSSGPSQPTAGRRSSSSRGRTPQCSAICTGTGPGGPPSSGMTARKWRSPSGIHGTWRKVGLAGPHPRLGRLPGWRPSSHAPQRVY